MAEKLLDTRRMTSDEQRRIASIGLRPMLQFQVSLLRLWAHNAEVLARNYEKALEGFRADVEQRGEVEQQGHQRAA
jgi:hypothetical protein